MVVVGSLTRGRSQSMMVFVLVFVAIIAVVMFVLVFVTVIAVVMFVLVGMPVFTMMVIMRVRMPVEAVVMLVVAGVVVCAAPGRACAGHTAQR